MNEFDNNMNNANVSGGTNPYYQNNMGQNNMGQNNMGQNNMGQNNMGGNMPENKPSSAIAITSFVLGIISIVTCCFFINIPLGIVSIILAIIALVKKHGGKGFSIAGLILSIISLLFSLVMFISMLPVLKYMPDIMDDMNKFINNYDEVIERYDETGELPDYMDKYQEGELGEFFEENYGGFDNFFERELRDLNE